MKKYVEIILCTVVFLFIMNVVYGDEQGSSKDNKVNVQKVEKLCMNLAKAQFLFDQGYQANALGALADNLNEDNEDTFLKAMPNPLSNNEAEQKIWSEFASSQPEIAGKYILIFKKQYFNDGSVLDSNDLTKQALSKATETLNSQAETLKSYQKSLIKFNEISTTILTIQAYLSSGQYEIAEKVFNNFHNNFSKLEEELNNSKSDENMSVFITKDIYEKIELKIEEAENDVSKLSEIKAEVEKLISDNQKDFQTVKNEFDSSINAAFAIVYYSQGMCGNGSKFDAAIEKAKAISNDPDLSNYIQGLCYLGKALLRENDIDSVNNSKALLTKIVQKRQNEKLAYVDHSIRLLNYIENHKLFINDASTATLAGNINLAISRIETGLHIHPNNNELAIALLDSYRRSRFGVEILTEQYDKYKDYIENDNDGIIAKSLFLSHIFDKQLASDVSKYKTVVEKYRSDCTNYNALLKSNVKKLNDFLDSDLKVTNEVQIKQVQRACLAMTQSALEYSMSFTKESVEEGHLRNLANISSKSLEFAFPGENIPAKPFSSLSGNEKSMKELLFREIRIKAQLAYSRSTLSLDTEKTPNSKKVAALDGYMLVNNLESDLPYNSSISSHDANLQKGDALLMGLRNYPPDIISKIKMETQVQSNIERDELVNILKSAYSLYLANLNEVESELLFADRRADNRASNSSRRLPAKSLAEEEFNCLLEASSKSSMINYLIALKALQMVRENDFRGAFAYLSENFNDSAKEITLTNIQILEKNIDSINKDEEKALLLFALAETLDCYNMSYELIDSNKMLNNDNSSNQISGSRIELCQIISNMYKQIILHISIEQDNGEFRVKKGLNYLNILAQRGNNRYKDDVYLATLIEKYRSDKNTQLVYSVKMVKKALCIHPKSNRLWRLWIQYEQNLLRRSDVINKSEYCTNLFNELLLLKEQNIGLEYGIEMLYGIANKELNKYSDALTHFDKASVASDAQYQDKLLALSLSAQVDSSLSNEVNN